MHLPEDNIDYPNITSNYDVFISYARSTSNSNARSLHSALTKQNISTFIDSSNIEIGEKFPKAISQALLSARVVVFFVDDVFFRRWYCLRELLMALSPFDELTRRGVVKAEKEAMLKSVVVALPMDEASPTEMYRLPSTVSAVNWPRADETDGLVSLVTLQLTNNSKSIGDLLDEIGCMQVKENFLDEGVIPNPGNLRGKRIAPLNIQPSIRDAFVGRNDELWRIHFTLSTLQGEAGAALTGALEGGGGFGKTRIAIEYLHRYGPLFYPGGIFWVDADVDDSRLEERFHNILSVLKPELPQLYDFRMAGRNAYQELAEAFHALPVAESVLLVIDNVPEPAEGELPRKLESWCPGIGKVTVLATSRLKISFGSRSIVELPVDVLSIDAAVTLLSHNIDSGLKSEDWKEIAEWVGRLPLALELLNEALKAGLSSLTLLEKTKVSTPTKEIDTQMEALRGQVPEGTLRGVTEALLISYERLAPIEQTASRLIACLSPETVPVAILDTLGNAIMDQKVRNTLVVRSFIKKVSDSTIPMYGVMHRIMADFLRSISPNLTEDLRVITNAISQIMKPNSCRDPKFWALLDLVAPHGEQVFKIHVNQGLVNNSIIELAQRIEMLYMSEGVSAQAYTLGHQSLNLAQNILGDEHPLTPKAMNNLAQILLRMGDFHGAKDLQEKGYQLFRRVLGNEHTDTLTTMANYASILTSLGDFYGAAALEEEVLEIRLRISGLNNADTLIVMNNLAESLRYQGNLSRAHELHEKALQISQSVLGVDHPDTLISMNCLAEVYKDLGEYQRACELHRKTLKMRLSVLGDNHSDTLSSMNNLAGVLIKIGKATEAHELYIKLIELCKNILGDSHPLTIISLSNLAKSYLNLGDMDNALEIQNKSFEYNKLVLGDDHPSTLACMNNLAEIFRAQSDVDSALTMHKKILGIRRKIYGDEHPDTLMSMSNLAVTFLEYNDLYSACNIIEKVLKVQRSNLGVEHPDTSITAFCLIGVLFQMKQFDSARNVIENNLEWIVKRSPRSLSATQNEIRDVIAQIMQRM